MAKTASELPRIEWSHLRPRAAGRCCTAVGRRHPWYVTSIRAAARWRWRRRRRRWRCTNVLRCDGSSVWLSPAREALPKVAPVTRWRWGPLRASRALIPLLTLTATAALAKLGAPVTATVALAGQPWLVVAREVADLRGALAAARAGVGSRLAELGAIIAARTLRRVLVTCGPREWFHDGLSETERRLFVITSACKANIIVIFDFTSLVFMLVILLLVCLPYTYSVCPPGQIIA